MGQNFTAGSLTHYAGTTTGANVAVVAKDIGRDYIMVQNLSDTAIYLKFGGTASAAAGSIMIPANGGYWENPDNFCPTDSVNVFGVAGKAFTVAYH